MGHLNQSNSTDTKDSDKSITLQVCDFSIPAINESDLSVIGLRCLAVRGTMSVTTLHTLLLHQGASIKVIEATLDMIVERGDALLLKTGDKSLLSPCRHRRFVLAGGDLDIGVVGSTEIIDTGSDTRTLAQILGPAEWRQACETEPASSDLPTFLRSKQAPDSEASGSPDLSAWARLAATDDIEAALDRNMADEAPQQLRRLSLLLKDWEPDARKALIPAVRRWTGLPIQESGALDTAQAEIAQRSMDARTLVVAPPGAGKTHTILARISGLIEKDCAATKILTLSFTRNAVQVLRTRLATISDGDEVGVSTLNSLAGQLVGEFSAASHDATIATATARLETEHPDSIAWLQTREHVIIDEAQDIVGVHRAFLLAMLTKLPPRCGVTLFCDPAQSIYGFQDAHSPCIVETIMTLPGFERFNLQRNYRSSGDGLRAIVAEGRHALDPAILSTEDNPFSAMQRVIMENASGPPPDLTNPLDRPNMILFRGTREMVHYAARLSRHGQRYRLRGGENRHEDQAFAPAWFGAAIMMLEDEGPSVLDAVKKAFGSDPVVPRGDALAAALSPALSHGRHSRRTAAEALIRGNAPPVTDTSNTVILSTIHAAKGLEADDVALYLPRTQQKDADLSEEARILYVGATRARHRLSVGMASTGMRKTRFKRHWTPERYTALFHVTATDAQETYLAEGVDPVAFAQSGTFTSPFLSWDAKRRLWGFGTRDAQGAVTVIAWMPETLTKDISEIAGLAGPDRPFVPLCQGQAHIRPITIARDDTLSIVPLVEGFFRLRFGKSNTV